MPEAAPAVARSYAQRRKATAGAREMRWALATLAAAIVPFFFALPFWIAGVGLVLIAWRALVLVRGTALPPQILRLLLAGAALVVVVVSFRGLGGAQAGGAFLVLTTALKALESRTRRDFHLVALLAFFLLAAVFLLQQSLPMGLYAAGLVWLAATALLIPGNPQSWSRLARRAGGLLLAALPVAAVFFVLFPRLPSPLFRFGAPRTAAVSGLPHRMDPGAIAALATSSAVAFRVHFRSAMPPARERYFRGPVFELFDGHEWLPGSRSRGRPTFRPRGRAVHYEVLERASGTRNLFALALPSQVSTAAHLDARYELLARHRLWNDIAFHATSYPHHRPTAPLSAKERARTLALPPGADPRTRALARRWRHRTQNPRSLVATALAWFRNKPFYYTLTPGRINGPNAVDRFLFVTRRGFCEHYASAFAVLMRAAGIPTRIVTGYAGGTINPYDGWLVLRQSNAHAWDEVWIKRRGWVRVDPTSVIPPDRVEASAAQAAATGPAANATLNGDHWLNGMRNLWDAVNTAWAQYVAGYGRGLQKRLLGRLGLRALSPLMTALIMIGAAFAAGALMILLLRFAPRRRRTDPAQRLYSQWCRRMARRGLRRAPAEGPLDFAERIRRLAPAWSDDAAEVTALYVRVRYAEEPAALTRLRRRVHRRR